MVELNRRIVFQVRFIISVYNASNSAFESYFGSMEKIKVRNGYQLLFIGIWKEIGSDGKQILHWSYNFSKANKYLPTLVFIQFSTPLSPHVRYTTINGLNYADTEE